MEPSGSVRNSLLADTRAVEGRMKMRYRNLNIQAALPAMNPWILNHKTHFESGLYRLKIRAATVSSIREHRSPADLTQQVLTG